MCCVHACARFLSSPGHQHFVLPVVLYLETCSIYLALDFVLMESKMLFFYDVIKIITNLVGENSYSIMVLEFRNLNSVILAENKVLAGRAPSRGSWQKNAFPAS